MNTTHTGHDIRTFIGTFCRKTHLQDKVTDTFYTSNIVIVPSIITFRCTSTGTIYLQHTF